MNILHKTTCLLILVAFFATQLIYGQTGKILIETQLTRYGPDLKSNTYSVNITTNGSSAFGKAYNLNNNDDDVKVYYDLVQYDETKYPLKIVINGSYVVKPTQLGGPECNQKDEVTLAAPKSVSMGACHGRTNFLLLDLPKPSGSIGNCGNFTVQKQIQLSGAGYSWQYKKNTDTQWKYFTYGTQYNENGINFNFNDVPDLKDYTGNLFVKFVVEYENLNTSKIETYESDIAIYPIIPCSPKLDTTSDPNFTTCSYSNGGVTFTFSRPLEPGEKYLFNRNPVGSTFITDATSNDPDVEKVSALSYKWKNIPAGVYEFKYQTQFGNNTPSTLSPVSKFEIKQSTPLTFTATAVQPVCSGGTSSSDKGGISFSVSGGMPPYFYILDNEPKKELTKNPDIIDITTDGEHKVIVVDSFNCIEK
ncbi:hypothetical protein [Flavobacterium sp. B183]|uniref:hypothetical protein n=1 Tax=Flavobacterium sp. B183 TaxID=907046 RepID=UPI00201FA665|nr:hypothetical protein [Flavobacterium sp. B183]URC11012.1 hypothetical protein M4I44_13005 [Flavobacterium sp. B183]